MTTSEVADTYSAHRATSDVAEAAAKTMAEYSLSRQDLIDALGKEILSFARPDTKAMQDYRNEVLKHFSK